MSQELLAQAIREEKQPKVCLLHRAEVFHDERECPCCRITREFKYGKLKMPGGIRR